MKLITLPFAGGCSARRLFGRADDPAAPAPPAAPATVTVTTTPAPAPLSAPDASGPCTDDDLVVAFVHACRLSRADLVTPAGGVLIHVPRRPANAAHHLTLNPGDVATADVTAYGIDTSTGDRAHAGATWSLLRPTDSSRTQ